MPQDLLREVWGFDDFRPGQGEIVQAVAAGRDVLAIMPTGGGKSLCYQLPALMRDGLTVVVSPLIALMRDQVRALTEAGVPAAALTSGNSEDENAEVLRALRGDLDAVVAALEALAADAEAPAARADLARALDAGVRGQARIPGKHGAAPQRFAVVTVQVPDRPGELARMLAAMGEAGVNLEDLRLEHVPDRLVGLAEVSVVPSSRERLEQVLRAGGWELAG